MDNCLVEKLSTSSVVEDNALTREMATLYFVELNVLFSAANDWISDNVVEFDEESFKIWELPRDYFNLFEFDKIQKFVDDNHISYLVILSW